MYINSVPKFNINSIPKKSSIKPQKQANILPPNTKLQENKKPLTLLVIGLLASISAVLLVLKNKNKTFDSKFKEDIIKALKKENIDVSKKALKSIVGKEELLHILRKTKPQDFQAGLQITDPNIQPEIFYKNSINGDFRISLHTHSNFSDGKATAEEFLECARKYADKVAKNKKSKRIPPFTIALTDHDNVEGCREIIKIIAKNPEKYKNLKFVAGCEFSVKNNNTFHDVTGLALNPFDEKLNNMLNELRNKRMGTIQEFLDKKEKIYNKKVTIDDLIELEKNHYLRHNSIAKSSIKNGSGIVSVRHAIKYFYEAIGKEVNKAEMNELGKKDVLPIETVVKVINENGGVASLTHPLKRFWRYIGDKELLRLKNMGIKGIEANHQYTPSKIIEIGHHNDSNKAYEILTKQYSNFAKANGMFISGGTDCHEKQIFSREPKISERTLKMILE